MERNKKKKKSSNNSIHIILTAIKDNKTTISNLFQITNDFIKYFAKSCYRSFILHQI